MEKKLLVLFVIAFSLLTSCTKKGDDSPEKSNTMEGCLQQNSIVYSSNGEVSSETQYHYTNGRLDSTVGFYYQNGNTTKTVARYNYINDLEREIYLYTNGVKAGYKTYHRLDLNGNIVEAYTITNSIKSGVTRNTFNCN